MEDYSPEWAAVISFGFQNSSAICGVDPTWGKQGWLCCRILLIIIFKLLDKMGCSSISFDWLRMIIVFKQLLAAIRRKLRKIDRFVIAWLDYLLY